MRKRNLKEMGKKIVADICCLLLLMTSVPTNVSADELQNFTCKNYADCNVGGECYEVLEDNVRVREAPEKYSNIIGYVSSSNLVKVKYFVTNNSGNTWAAIGYTDSDGEKEAYIYSERIALHKNHQMLSVACTKNGDISTCIVCGYSVATYNDGTTSETVECDLMCIADQAVLGDYYDNTTFWGLAARILVGELPGLGTAADVRDFVYDLTHGGNIVNLGLDAMALLPLVGAAKYSASLDNLKFTGKVADTITSLPWKEWKDYEKVIKNGTEYAKIGDFLYTEEAVNHFVPKSMLHYVTRDTFTGVKLDEARGVSPTYIQYVLKEGIKDGSTIKIASGDSRFAELINKGIVKNSKYTVFSNGSLDVITDGNIVVTVITTKRTTLDYLEIVKASQK